VPAKKLADTKKKCLGIIKNIDTKNEDNLTIPVIEK
jgi:hypothetical protein